MKRKVEEIHVIPKITIDSSWITNMERDLSHDGFLERYDRHKSHKRLAPLNKPPQNSPYFVLQRKRN